MINGIPKPGLVRPVAHIRPLIIQFGLADRTQTEFTARLPCRLRWLEAGIYLAKSIRFFKTYQSLCPCWRQGRVLYCPAVNRHFNYRILNSRRFAAVSQHGCTFSMVAMVRLDSQSAKTGFSDVITATIGAGNFLMACHAAINGEIQVWPTTRVWVYSW